MLGVAFRRIKESDIAYAVTELHRGDTLYDARWRSVPYVESTDVAVDLVRPHIGLYERLDEFRGYPSGGFSPRMCTPGSSNSDAGSARSPGYAAVVPGIVHTLVQ